MLATLRVSSRRVATRSFHASPVAPRAAFRKFSTVPPPPPKASSNTAIYIGLGLAAVGGAGYFFLNSGTDASREAGTAIKSAGQSIKAATPFVPSKEDYQKVYNRIAEILDADNYDDGSYGPLLVRLAWHCSGTYDKDSNTGGSNNATMRFAPESLHAANNGLVLARGIMETLHDEFPWISYGDLWTLAGVAAIQEMAGPKIPWRPGRIDGLEKDATPDGRLPDATQGQDHLRAIFYRMGFDDQEIVALAGAHALGRCHTDRSGFDGPWTFSPTTVTNAFYTLLLNEKWTWRKWSGPKQYEDKGSKSLMMLPSDMALVQDKKFAVWVKKYAADEELWLKDFSSAFARLLELGVPTSQFITAEPWEMKTIDEQSS